jgi:TRAP transporter 4TM/12TM fusion protein
MSSLDVLMGSLAILLVIEAGRRVLGWIMAVVPLIALVYASAGPLWPGMLAHRGFSPLQIIDYLYLGYDGIFGMPVGVSATYMVLFIIFGTFMEKSGTGQFIMDFAFLLTGRSRGGPAKAAVVASALFGSVSGAAVANVYTTGTFTIPMMKRTGYGPAFAGAVESVASTGGQLMPPVLGVAAFVMTEWIGVPYIDICKAALIPAILYFLAVAWMVHLEALKTKLPGLTAEQIPKRRDVFGRAYLFIPLAALIYVLLSGYTVFRSVFIAIIVAFVVSFFRKDSRMGIKKLLGALELGAKRAVTIAVATSCAGIVIGVFTLTGVGLSMTSSIVLYFKEYLLLALILTMFASIILGMGVPTVVAYIIVATLAAPLLTRLGLPLLTAHMFVFYFGIIAMITPPVAIAVFAAAEIAQSNYLNTGINAVKLGIVAFLVPFMFVYGPALLSIGSALEVLLATFSAIVGVISMGAGLQGWLLTRTAVWQTILLLTAGLALIHYGLITDLVGLSLFVGVLGIQKVRLRLSPV